MSLSAAAVADLRIAVIGAGAAGRSFTRLCLDRGLAVVLEDVLPERLRRAELEVGHSAAATGSSRLQTVTTVEEAVREADLAIDFVPDELESKLEIFSLIDRMAPPRTVLLTPTAVLSISDLASCTYRADRCFALHRAQPEQLSVVTLSHPAAPAPQALQLVQALLTHLGMAVTVVEDVLPSDFTRRPAPRL